VREIVYHSAVREEVLAAVRYYEDQADGLGLRFIEDFDSAIADIRKHCSAWPYIDRNYRKHQLRHFPYGIIYRIKKDHIRVLAVMHLHRKPGYWKRRK